MKSEKIEIVCSKKIIAEKAPEIPQRDDLNIISLDQECLICHSPMICVCTGDIGTVCFDCYSVHLCLNLNCKQLVQRERAIEFENLGSRTIIDHTKCLLCSRDLSLVEAKG